MMITVVELSRSHVQMLDSSCSEKAKFFPSKMKSLKVLCAYSYNNEYI